MFTRVVENRKAKSIIDYVLIHKGHRSEILDVVRVKRGPELFSDHYMLLAKVRIRRKERNKNKYLEKHRTFGSELTN